MEFKIVFDYVYSFISFGEELLTDVRSECFDTGTRFKLNSQEDGSFTVSAPMRDNLGTYAILTFPNKDKLIVREEESAELAYDEFFDAMGDSNHNVYIGTVRLKKS